MRHDETDEPPAEKVAGIKLYVLEEMFYWTEREDKALSRFKYFNEQGRATRTSIDYRGLAVNDSLSCTR
jgi:hypothetical protein